MNSISNKLNRKIQTELAVIQHKLTVRILIAKLPEYGKVYMYVAVGKWRFIIISYDLTVYYTKH